MNAWNKRLRYATISICPYSTSILKCFLKVYGTFGTGSELRILVSTGVSYSAVVETEEKVRSCKHWPKYKPFAIICASFVSWSPLLHTSLSLNLPDPWTVWTRGKLLQGTMERTCILCKSPPLTVFLKQTLGRILGQTLDQRPLRPAAPWVFGLGCSFGFAFLNHAAPLSHLTKNAFMKTTWSITSWVCLGPVSMSAPSRNHTHCT